MRETIGTLFGQGRELRMFEYLGAHPGQGGTRFAVWAPNAAHVSVIGDFNEWQAGVHPLTPDPGQTGVWQGIVPGVGVGDRYRFDVESRWHGYRTRKADPVGFFHESAPGTASIVWDLNYAWNDDDWMEKRGPGIGFDAPVSIYEVHIGSWRRGDGNHLLSYREIAPLLIAHVKRLHFTHVEFLPVMEHPFYGSWGYQVTGYFAPTSRYGTPQDFMALIDALHQEGIGVILDWVPSHFPRDDNGLGFFDGTHLYEHENPKKGLHPDWDTYIFNYGRHEVQSFLSSNAYFWLKQYHIDALRVDAVASMLYLDYSRQPGQWIPNHKGGRENLEAIDWLRNLNRSVYAEIDGIAMIAEESTAWPGVSRPVEFQGLGFGYKWDMGWMHDTLDYVGRDAIYRRYHHHDLTFRPVYAFSENFILPLSHDEVVHGKGSLWGKIPGDDWQKAATLRLLLGYQMASPGKKLLFMGQEFGQEQEWNHDQSLDWHLVDQPLHRGVLDWVADSNQLYREVPALYEGDCRPEGFRWVKHDDAMWAVLAFLRMSRNGAPILAVVNWTPVPREGYQLGVPQGGAWCERLNSDALSYGGSGLGNGGRVYAVVEPYGGFPYSVYLTLPPLAMLILEPCTL